MQGISSEELNTIRQALNGDRGEDQRRIAQQGMALIGLLLRKNSDYGSSAWQPPILAPDMSPREAIQCRMSDKIQRFIQLQSKAAEVEESLEDTVRDWTGYGVLWLGAPTDADTL
jgi:hypothetical protein